MAQRVSTNRKPSLFKAFLRLESLDERNAPSDLLYGALSADYASRSWLSDPQASNPTDSKSDTGSTANSTTDSSSASVGLFDLIGNDNSSDVYVGRSNFSNLFSNDALVNVSVNINPAANSTSTANNVSVTSATPFNSTFNEANLFSGTQSSNSLNSSGSNTPNVSADFFGFGFGGWFGDRHGHNGGGGGSGGGGGTGGGGSGGGGSGGGGGTTVSVAGFSPTQIDTAYGIPATYTGAGVTIAIIDAYNAANLTSDVSTFNTKFNLPQFNTTGGPTLKVVNQTGGSTLPAANSSWAAEIDLDVEWAHAIAPKANIELVEANSSNLSDLLTAASYGAAHAQVVSMSFGGSETSNETSLDSTFKVPNVAFVAAAGDSGTGAGYPSASPYVLSVGGTTLTVTSSGARSSESAWSSSGGGVSAYEAEPAYQVNYGITSTGGKRGTPDIAFDANPSTGVAVYSSASGGWIEVGGTSVGAPAISGMIALVDQGRIALGKPVISTTNLSNEPFYAAAASSVYKANYYDVTTGSDGRSTSASAKTGYDLVTGLGTPNAASLIPWLINND